MAEDRSRIFPARVETALSGDKPGSYFDGEIFAECVKCRRKQTLEEASRGVRGEVMRYWCRACGYDLVVVMPADKNPEPEHGRKYGPYVLRNSARLSYGIGRGLTRVLSPTELPPVEPEESEGGTSAGE